MRKTMFAAALLCMGGFALGTAAPASAMDANALGGIGDAAKSSAVVKVEHHEFCWHHPNHWNCRHHERRWERRHERRVHCWWHHGRRICD